MIKNKSRTILLASLLIVVIILTTFLNGYIRTFEKFTIIQNTTTVQQIQPNAEVVGGSTQLLYQSQKPTESESPLPPTPITVSSPPSKNSVLQPAQSRMDYLNYTPSAFSPNISTIKPIPSAANPPTYNNLETMYSNAVNFFSPSP
jgi:hypothetical protein